MKSNWNPQTLKSFQHSSSASPFRTFHTSDEATKEAEARCDFSGLWKSHHSGLGVVPRWGAAPRTSLGVPTCRGVAGLEGALAAGGCSVPPAGWGGASAATCWSGARLQTDVWLSGRWVRCAYVMWSLWKADCLPWNSWWALLCPRTLPSGWVENTDLQAVIFFSAFHCFTVVICLTWNRWNETTFSAIFYFIKISMQRTSWGGKWSPERLMQFFIMLGRQPPYLTILGRQRSRLTQRSNLQDLGGGGGQQIWHQFLAVSIGHFRIWRVLSIHSLKY